jgi:hypothetical protein
MNADQKAFRRHLTEFGVAMAGYVVVLLITVRVVEAFPEALWRYLVAVLPVVPIVFVLWAVQRAIGRMDELQRRVQLEGIAFASVGTGVLTFAYGFLEGVGLPHLSWTLVLPLMFGLWGIGVALAGRRYR